MSKPLSKFFILRDAIYKVKNGLTLPEIVKKTGMNENTARRELGEAGFPTFKRKCRVTNKVRTAYKKAALLSF